MIKIIKSNKWIITLFLLFTANLLNAQSNEVEMADALRESGKIYVVVSVLLVIFSGIIIYLVNLERKIRVLEKKLNQQ